MKENDWSVLRLLRLCFYFIVLKMRIMGIVSKETINSYIIPPKRISTTVDYTRPNDVTIPVRPSIYQSDPRVGGTQVFGGSTDGYCFIIRRIDFHGSTYEERAGLQCTFTVQPFLQYMYRLKIYTNRKMKSK